MGVVQNVKTVRELSSPDSFTRRTDANNKLCPSKTKQQSVEDLRGADRHKNRVRDIIYQSYLQQKADSGVEYVTALGQVLNLHPTFYTPV